MPGPALMTKPLRVLTVRSAVVTLIIFLASAFGFQAPASAQSNVQGQWKTLPTQMPINPVHVALMHNGKVLIVSGSGNLPSDTTYLGGSVGSRNRHGNDSTGTLRHVLQRDGCVAGWPPFRHERNTAIRSVSG